MKRVFSICLALLIVASLSLTAFAVEGGFVSSPSGRPAPRLISFFVESDECDADLIITSYSERDTLPQEERDMLEIAYDLIKATSDLTTLNADLDALAEKLDIPGVDLAVSDLFDIRNIGCDPETHSDEKHGYFSIKLEAETLKNFVGLLHFHDGNRELVSNATVDGDILTFKVDDLSPFAIIVDTDPPAAPGTGDVDYIWVLAAIAVVSCAAMIVCWVKYRKQSA